MIDEGVRLFKNPWGNELFGASFFTITGLHLTHVVDRNRGADRSRRTLQERASERR